MKKLLLAITTISVCFYSLAASAAEDFKGAKDHPKVPRIEGSVIRGYSYSNFGEGVFHTSMINRSFNKKTAEGKHTKIVYLGPKTLTPLGALRNYQKAFAALGEVTEIFSCRRKKCFNNVGGKFVWSSDNRIPNNLNLSEYLYHNWYYYKDQIYWHATIKSPSSEYVVSFYASLRTNKDNFRDRRDIDITQPLIHIEIVEKGKFSSSLKTTKASDVSKQISETGHIALYDIFFDSGKDRLKSNSWPALSEITKVLKDDPGLNIYVVGHTDNDGSVASNQDLSVRRATSVIRELITKHGIKADRLHPIGVGLAAPVASNDTEKGKALNRRVELVKR